ncbi:MAG: SDR family oxidoreductase [Verrucomicrobiota bacterium]
MIKSALKSVVWITGAGGLIGNYLVQLAPRFAPQCEAISLTRAQLDLLDFMTVRAAFRSQKPAAIIHCAAMSKSPECQANPTLARKTNVESTALLAELAAEMPFIFFSTDLVFNGRQGNYVETDAVEPLSIYAETKLLAEQIVLTNPCHTVIRTSLNGGTSPSGDRGFNEQIRRAWQAGQTPSFFTDEYRSPISAAITARATWELLQQKRTGLFHVAGAERMSRASIGEALATRWPQLNPKFTVSSLKDYHGAPRSPDTSLNSAKAQAHLSFPLPGLTDWLRNNPDEVF